MQLPALPTPLLRAALPRVAVWLDAARSGVVESLRVLCEDAEDLLCCGDGAGWTALHWCAARDHVAATRWLLAAGAPPDLCSSAGHTALHIAAHHGFIGPLVALLEGGASPLARSRAKLSALHHGAASCSVETVSRLLASGAALLLDAATDNRDGSTPLAIAARTSATATGQRRASQSRAVLKLLEDESKRLKKWFRAARMVDLPTMVEMMDAEGVAGGGGTLVNAMDGSGQTALFPCVRSARLDGVRLLLTRGAKPNHADSAGNTALHHLVMAAAGAERHGLVRVLEPLLAAGADARAKNVAGRTACAVLRDALQRVPRGTVDAGHLPLSRCLAELGQDLACAEARSARMAKWRLCARVVGKLARWHARSVERAYAPGGCGYNTCLGDFEERSGKRPRDEVRPQVD